MNRLLHQKETLCERLATWSSRRHQHELEVFRHYSSDITQDSPGMDRATRVIQRLHAHFTMSSLQYSVGSKRRSLEGG